VLPVKVMVPGIGHVKGFSGYGPKKERLSSVLCDINEDKLAGRV
jgi:hypothetical protein